MTRRLRAPGRLLALVAAGVLLAGFAACGDDKSATPQGQPKGGTESSAAAPSPGEPGPGSAGGDVTVYATEYAFDLPETLPAGETTFQLVNNGEEPHMFIVAQLTDDSPPVEKLIKMDEKESDKYIVKQEVIPPVDPGTTGEKTVTMDLQPGATYGYVCFVPSPKKSEGHGKPHAFLGMYGSFTVQ